MRILVTGSQGFIGRNLVRYLRRHSKHEVYGVDLVGSGEENYLRADLRRLEDLRGAFERAKPEVVIHLAHDFRSIDNCIDMIRNVVKLCRETRSWLIYVSSGSVFGRCPREVPVPEDHPYSPDTPYGYSKTVCELYVRSFSDLDYTIVRPCNVIGYGCRNNFVAVFWQRIASGERIKLYFNGEQMEDVIHVKDFCSVLSMIVESNVKGIVNVAGHVVRYRDVVEKLIQYSGRKVEVEYVGYEESLRQGAKYVRSYLRTRLKYELRVDLESALRDVVSKHIEIA